MSKTELHRPTKFLLPAISSTLVIPWALMPSPFYCSRQKPRFLSLPHPHIQPTSMVSTPCQYYSSLAKVTNKTKLTASYDRYVCFTHKSAAWLWLCWAWLTLVGSRQVWLQTANQIWVCKPCLILALRVKQQWLPETWSFHSGWQKHKRDDRNFPGLLKLQVEISTIICDYLVFWQGPVLQGKLCYCLASSRYLKNIY